MNEYVHDASEKDLKGLVVQATGAEPDSRVVAAIVGSFKALKAFANFEQVDEGEEPPVAGHTPLPPGEHGEPPPRAPQSFSRGGFNLAYTINLNLPATTDIAVFDAIFKSLKEHLLKP